MEWRLHAWTFHRLILMFDLPKIDLFASPAVTPPATVSHEVQSPDSEGSRCLHRAVKSMASCLSVPSSNNDGVVMSVPTPLFILRESASYSTPVGAQACPFSFCSGVLHCPSLQEISGAEVFHSWGRPCVFIHEASHTSTHPIVNISGCYGCPVRSLRFISMPI